MDSMVELTSDMNVGDVSPHVELTGGTENSHLDVSLDQGGSSEQVSLLTEKVQYEVSLDDKTDIVVSSSVSAISYDDIKSSSNGENDERVKEKELMLQDSTSGSSINDNFVGRVSKYPVVASTLDKAWNLYSACKESNEVIKYSLDSAESGVKYVSNTISPVVNKLEKPISSVNSVACSGLDIVEKNCPIVQKPTDEVIAETKNMYETKIKPSVDKVVGVGQYASETCSGVKNYGVSKVNEVTSYTSEKIGMVRDTSYEKIGMIRDKSYETINAALASQTAQNVLDKIDGALTAAENYLDDNDSEKKDEEKCEKAEEIDEAEIKSKPVVVYGKAKNKLYRHAMEKLNNIKLRSQETLERFNFTVNLIDYAKANLSSVNESMAASVQSARNKGAYWWDEITKEEEEVKDEDRDADDVIEPAQQTMEAQALKVARRLTGQLRTAIHQLNEKNIPENLVNRYQAAKQYSLELAGSFVAVTRMEDLSDGVMTRAREQAVYIQDTISSVAEAAADNWPANQVVPDFIIDDLGDSDYDYMDENENSVDN